MNITDNITGAINRANVVLSLPSIVGTFPNQLSRFTGVGGRYTFSQTSFILGIHLSSSFSHGVAFSTTIVMALAMETNDSISITDSGVLASHVYTSLLTTTLGDLLSQTSWIGFNYPFFPRINSNQSVSCYGSQDGLFSYAGKGLATIYYVPATIMENYNRYF